jgi:hypothetical protein
MEVFIMNEQVKINETVKEQRGRMFSVTVGLTLVIGVAAAILAIWHFSPPPPVVVQTPPETKVVEKVVYVPKAAPVAPALPPAPIVELPHLVPVALPPEPPTVAKIAATGVWDGVWRRKESPLPMFRLHQEDNAVAGTCAANWGPAVPLHGCGVTEDALEFVVDDVVSRVHIRMALDGQGKAKVEQWVTDDDWMTSLERANKTAKTPQQAHLVKVALQQNARKFRKPVLIGVFNRQLGE